MTTRKNSSPKPVKKVAPKKSAAPAKKNVSSSAPAKFSSSNNGEAKAAAPSVPEFPPATETISAVQPSRQPTASPWRVFSQSVGPNLFGGPLDLAIDLRGENLDTAPQFVSVSAEGIAPEFGDAFAFRILERTADYVRVRVHRLDENGGSWGGNLVVQVLCVF